MPKKLPDWFNYLKEHHENFIDSLDDLGKIARQDGPLDEKTAQLVQLAAAATIRSEGAVHSHTRRAIEAGATPAELSHALILLTSTIGFPTVSAALSWVHDIIGKKQETRRKA